MFIHVLGSGAGGGFPQWNCNCRNCSRIRKGEMKGTPRTQSSITVSSNGVDWVLFNASPDIRVQLGSFPPMQPGRTVRDTGICAILLVDAQIDHTTGLILLREHTEPWDVYCTKPVYGELTSSYPLINILSHFRGVNWHEIQVDESSFTIPKADNLIFTAVPLKSEAPPFSPYRHKTRPGDNIGVRVEDTSTGKVLLYVPGLGEMEPHVQCYMEDADCILVDGTVWTDNELCKEGISDKRAKEMGHLDQSGEDGIISILKPLTRPQRKILIHINNTNPILDEESPEHQELVNAGIELAYDGMDITL
jgi:pyrroloquinoline quinone biosynthesis protein B